MGAKRLLPALVTGLVLVVGYGLRQGKDLNTAALEQYHAHIAEAVEQLPYRLGDWEGTDVPIPVAARQLLRPNALFSRTYRNRKTGVECSVVLVHCRDTRDMVGHYPPICYPANGWTSLDDSATERPHDFERVYRFTRTNGRETMQITVWSFFVVPVAGQLQNLEALLNADEVRSRRTLGAAQVQIVFGRQVDLDQQREITAEFKVMLAPVLTLVKGWPS